MLEKLKNFFETKKEQREQNYDLTFDNVAIPEVHTHTSNEHNHKNEDHSHISYDNVAIPEVHIRNTKDITNKGV